MIVGIGASGGGMESVKEILRHLGAQVSFAIIIVQHINHSGEELLANVLRQSSSLPLQTIERTTVIQPGHIYLAPPHRGLAIRDGQLQVETLAASQRHTPIDDFLFSLAADQKGQATGIILSGGGIDGTLGLKAISDASGLTIVQAPDSAKASSMPESAISLGIVDYILPPAEIAREILRHAEHYGEENDGGDESELTRQILAAIPDIAAAIEKQTENDFKHYKTTTLVRRIRRRLQQPRFGESVPQHQYRDHLLGPSPTHSQFHPRIQSDLCLDRKRSWATARGFDGQDIVDAGTADCGSPRGSRISHH